MEQGLGVLSYFSILSIAKFGPKPLLGGVGRWCVFHREGVYRGKSKLTERTLCSDGDCVLKCDSWTSKGGIS